MLGYENLDFGVMVRRLRDDAQGINLPERYAPASCFWLVEGGRTLVGVAHLRHRLTPLLQHEGGHIGYATRIAHFFFGSRALRLPRCVWDGESYTELRVNAGRDANRLGLRFLARHLVTFDFPKSMLYLKKTSTGPLSAGKTGEESKPSRPGARESAFVLVAQQGGSIVIEGNRN